MRITVVTTVGRTIAAFLEDQIAELVDRGHRVTLLCAAPDELAALPERLRVEVVEAPWTRPLRSRSLPGVWRVTRSLPALCDADLVYVHTAIAATITRLALATRRDRPIVVYCAHGFAGAAARPWWRRTPPRLVEAILARYTDVVIVMNDEDEEWARRRDLHVVRVPSVGFDLPEQRGERPPDRTTSDPVVLLTMAELTARKRIHLALEALAALPDRYQLCVAGGGPEEHALRRRADELGVARRVEFIGHTTDPIGTLRRADIFVSTSEQEGLARSVLEAMAVGVPVVGLDARGVTDLIGRGAGVVVTAAHGAALAAAIEELWSDRDRRGRMVAAAAEVTANHGLDQVTPLFVSAIESAHRRRRWW